MSLAITNRGLLLLTQLVHDLLELRITAYYPVPPLVHPTEHVTCMYMQIACKHMFVPRHPLLMLTLGLQLGETTLE